MGPIDEAAGVILIVLLILLILFYFRGGFRRRICYNLQNTPETQDLHFYAVVTGLTSSLPSQAEVIEFFVKPEEIYAARQKAIRSAQQSIHFETFYVTPGRRADEFAVAVMERARAGVKVQMIVDHLGSVSMPDRYWRSLRSAGVEVGFFRRFSWRAPFDYNERTHRKLLLVDGQLALIGGAGISDAWDGEGDTGSNAPWRDFEVQYRGPIVNLLEGVFMENWANVGGTLDLSPQIFREIPAQGSVAFVTTGNFSLEDSSLRVLFHVSISAARRRLWIASPYFVPDFYTKKALIKAYKNGVDVRILTMGPYNDKSVIYYAARENYQDLLANDIQIYEYQPNMMHAKAFLVDDQWVSHGSTNVDERSFFQNDEMNISMSDRTLAQAVERFLLESFEHSKLITLESWKQRSVWQQFQGRFGLLFRQLL